MGSGLVQDGGWKTREQLIRTLSSTAEVHYGVGKREVEYVYKEVCTRHLPAVHQCVACNVTNTKYADTGPSEEFFAQLPISWPSLVRASLIEGRVAIFPNGRIRSSNAVTRRRG